MDTTENTAPAHHVPEAIRERVLRGLLLAADHAEEIVHEGHGVYTVPGCSGGTYTVDLVPFGGTESCNCPDRAPVCKHLVAATIFRSKSRAAARRVGRPRFTPETVEAGLARMGA